MLMNMFMFACFLDENARLTTTSPYPMHLVCTFKTVFAGTTRTCVSTCGRGAGTHGDVLNLHTVGFSNVSHHTPHTHHNTRNNNNNNTRRQSHRQTERRQEEDRARSSRCICLFIPDLTSACDPELVT